LNGQKSQQFIQEIIDKFEDHRSLEASKKLVLEALLLHRQKNFDDKKGYFSATNELKITALSKFSQCCKASVSKAKTGRQLSDCNNNAYSFDIIIK
jgi:hypothetical protein